MCNDFFFIAAKVYAVSRFDSGIKSLVCGKKIIWHFFWIIKIGKRI